jgi:hypothetical protein
MADPQQQTLAFQGLPPTVHLDPIRPATSDGVRCSSPDPSRYYDPATVSREIDGQSLLSVVGAPYGMRGVVIPRATWGGASMGHDAYQPGVINIDPHEAHSVSLDLRHVTGDDVRSATALVRRELGKPRDINDVRASAAATFHVLGKMDEMRSAASAAGTPPPVTVAPSPPAPLPPRAPVTGQAPAGRLAAVFAPTTAAQPGVQGAAQVAEPAHAVHFELEAGDFDANYHSVIRQASRANPTQGILVLGVVAAYRGPRFTPKASGPFVLQVAGQSTVMKVETTGIQFEHAGEILSLYIVLDEKPAAGG